MFFEIHHQTSYRYNAPVRLGNHILRLKPSDNGYQRLLEYELHIDPNPVLLVENLDAWGNRVFEVWFEGETEHLDIRCTLAAETLRDNAFDFLLAPHPLNLPVDYGDDSRALAAYLEPVEDKAEVSSFIEPLVVAHGNDPLAFLDALTSRIHGFYHHGVRLEGAARGPAETLSRQEGVCRDLTALFMAACRTVGIASRFISGYQQGDGTREIRYLHAWPEVYLPGGGWRAYDPTHNAAVADTHIAIACAGNPTGATPVTGSFSGREGPVETTLSSEIHIATSD